MNYEESLRWLYGFEQYGWKLGLERISYLVNELGNPQSNVKIIHVAGSNGKGSVCKFIAGILQKAGYRVGVYTSPHLERFSERIVVNNEEISQEDIVSLVEKIKPIVEEMIGDNNAPTFFEIVTAMAFQFFSDCNVDFAVVEVGLGGRFDATNVVTPVVSVITDISLEHRQQLGEDIESIAFEKAGIIKENIPVVTAAKYAAKDVVEKIAEEKNAEAVIVDRKCWKRRFCSMSRQGFQVKGLFNDYTVETSILGEYQGENIALAVAALEQLQIAGVCCFTVNDVVEGVKSAFNPGRMEIMCENPVVLLDGAHNPAGMEMLKESLEKDFEYRRLIVVLGVLMDKDIESMLSAILPVSDVTIVTKSNNPRSCPPSVLKDKIRNLGYKKILVVEDSISKAVDLAMSMADKKDVICVTGSLFTVGEARSYLAKKVKCSSLL
jgi:dihydrofolate synthase/folylpolyglutamate synthase